VVRDPAQKSRPLPPGLTECPWRPWTGSFIYAVDLDANVCIRCEADAPPDPDPREQNEPEPVVLYLYP
jgi:hypothetical protein